MPAASCPRSTPMICASVNLLVRTGRHRAIPVNDPKPQQLRE
jgi:hypothetical protein